ncbi:MAG: CDP-alcohol phosphatidyltransferase family protein [Bryobacteraceae bacterium]
MTQIPNLLSASRLVLAPFVFLLLWRREYSIALALLGIAGITDALDGLFARRFGAASRLGAYLDPIADKVLLSGIFLTLALDGAIEPWLAILVLGRDTAILLFAGGAFLFSKSLREFPPSTWGKGSTVAQILFILALVSHLAGIGSEPIVTALKWLTVAATAGSGLDYAWRGLRMVKATT